jgi:hypothetical protein
MTRLEPVLISAATAMPGERSRRQPSTSICILARQLLDRELVRAADPRERLAALSRWAMVINTAYGGIVRGSCETMNGHPPFRESRQ